MWGRRPRRLVDPIKIIRAVSMRHHVRPFGEWISIICFTINLTTHCWKIIRRLVEMRLDDFRRRDGRKMIRITIGKPIIVGVIKEANKFSFILILKDF